MFIQPACFAVKSHPEFATHQVPTQPNTTPVPVATPSKEASPKGADVLEVMQGNDSLARNCRKQLQNTNLDGPSSIEGVLDDTAFQNMPNPEENTIEPVGNAVEQLLPVFPAAPARLKQPTLFVILNNSIKQKYYQPQLTISQLFSIGQKLAKACVYPDVTVSLNTYKNGTAYACITFQKRIDHAEKTYRELCYHYDIPETKRVNLASLNLAVKLKMLELPHTFQEIEQLEQKRTKAFETFVTKAYVNGAPADTALESIYRPTHEQRLPLLKGHPNPYEYMACTDCLIFAYKRVLDQHTT